MRKWQCIVCGFVYDEAVGLPEDGIAAGTRDSRKLGVSRVRCQEVGLRDDARGGMTALRSGGTGRASGLPRPGACPRAEEIAQAGCALAAAAACSRHSGRLAVSPMRS